MATCSHAGFANLETSKDQVRVANQVGAQVSALQSGQDTIDSSFDDIKRAGVALISTKQHHECIFDPCSACKVGNSYGGLIDEITAVRKASAPLLG